MHRIRRQLLELELPYEKGAAAMAQQAGQLFKEKVLPKLEKVFDQIAPKDQIIRIPYLELNLDQIDKGSFEKEFTEQCVQQIIQHIEQYVFRTSLLDEKESTILATPTEKAVESIQHFIKTGRLPWHTKDWSIQKLETIVQTSIQENEFPKSFNLKQILTNNPRVQQRLLWQFSLDFVLELLESVFQLPSKTIQKTLYTIEQQLEESLSHSEKEELVLAIIQSPKIIASLQDHKLSELPSLLFELEGVQRIITNKVGVSKLKEWLYSPQNLESIPAKEDRQTNQSKETSLEIGLQTAKKNNEKELEQNPFESTNNQKELEDGILIPYAGLVLLTPYLAAFFNNLGIHPSADRPEDSYRAIYLLHFLASGQEQAEEHQLPFLKLLSGLDLEAPIPKDIQVKEAEKIEANQLLNAVIQNWSVLKNTSPDGLREAFLQRDGLLSYTPYNNSWSLRIERKSMDLLLEKLPWGYSIIKLNWMNEMIHVEW